jgi:hypothetical protein
MTFSLTAPVLAGTWPALVGVRAVESARTSDQTNELRVKDVREPAVLNYQ